MFGCRYRCPIDKTEQKATTTRPNAYASSHARASLKRNMHSDHKYGSCHLTAEELQQIEEIETASKLPSMPNSIQHTQNPMIQDWRRQHRAQVEKQVRSPSDVCVHDAHDTHSHHSEEPRLQKPAMTAWKHPRPHDRTREPTRRQYEGQPWCYPSSP